MVEKEELPEGRRTDRRSYLKQLALGDLGVGALLGLKNVPKANAASLTLGADETTNDASSNPARNQHYPNNPLKTLIAHKTTTPSNQLHNLRRQ